MAGPCGVGHGLQDGVCGGDSELAETWDRGDSEGHAHAAVAAGPAEPRSVLQDQLHAICGNPSAHNRLAKVVPCWVVQGAALPSGGVEDHQGLATRVQQPERGVQHRENDPRVQRRDGKQRRGCRRVRRGRLRRAFRQKVAGGAAVAIVPSPKAVDGVGGAGAEARLTVARAPLPAATHPLTALAPQPGLAAVTQRPHHPRPAAALPLRGASLPWTLRSDARAVAAQAVPVGGAGAHGDGLGARAGVRGQARAMPAAGSHGVETGAGGIAAGAGNPPNRTDALVPLHRPRAGHVTLWSKVPDSALGAAFALPLGLADAGGPIAGAMPAAVDAIDGGAGIRALRPPKSILTGASPVARGAVLAHTAEVAGGVMGGAARPRTVRPMIPGLTGAGQIDHVAGPVAVADRP
mmetsp:Transcript_38383/g.68607  ORF Transcript_38383/g.68607 Transcript_38383/m.68607 type:complete len:407 (+) Transcript_38383:344-1564(+)